MSDENKMKNLEVESEFKSITKYLSNVLEKVEKECLYRVGEVNAYGSKFDTTQLKYLLDGIDNYIEKNPIIKKARIEGKEDVQKIIDLLNQEVKGKLKIIEDNLVEADRIGFEDLVEDFENNETNKKQKELKKFESRNISTKNMEERKEAAKKLIRDKKQELTNLESFEKLFKEAKSADQTGKKDDATILAELQSRLKSEAEDVTKTSKQLNKNQASYNKILEANEYKTIFKEIYDKIKDDESNVKELTKEDLKSITEKMKILESLMDNTTINNLLSQMRNKNIMTIDNKTKEITKIDTDKLMPILNDDKYLDFDWEAEVQNTKSNYEDISKKEIRRIVKSDIFKLYPEKLDEIKNALSSGVSIWQINNLVRSITQENLDKKVIDLGKNLKSKPGIKLQILEAQTAIKNFENIDKKVGEINSEINSRQSTTRARLFEQNFELENTDATAIDFSDIQYDTREEAIEKTYSAYGNNDEFTEKFNNEASKKDKKPGLVARALHNVIHPVRRFKDKETLASLRKEKWIKEEIGKNHIAKTKEDVLEELYDQVRAGNQDELNRQYDLAYPVKYRNPGKIRKFIYKLMPKNWRTGKGLADERKENWVKEQIKKQIEDIEHDAKGEKSWTLTPDEEENFRNAEQGILEQVKAIEEEAQKEARKKGRENIVNQGGNANNASKITKKEYEKIQLDKDAELDI